MVRFNLGEAKEFFQQNKLQAAIVVFALLVGLFSYVLEQKGKEGVLSGTPVATKTPVVSSLLSQTQSAPTPRQSTCLSIEEAGNFIGEEKCVRGKVVSVYVSQKGNTFLNFCANYRSCPFYAVVFASQQKSFSELEGLKGRVVELQGLIKTYQGKPEIILDNPSQLRVID